MPARIILDPTIVSEFCRRHSIWRLSLFGSALREDFGPESDLDVLVEFEPGARVGLFDMVSMEAELTRLLDRAVDLRTPKDLSRYFRQDVLDTAEVLYARG